MKFVGCDVSKDKIDINLINEKGVEVSRTIQNQLKSIEKFFSTLPKDYSLCAENTGSYSQLLFDTAYYYRLNPVQISSHSIKYGSGTIRGKTDKIDALRIREFATRFQSRLFPYHPENQAIIELRELLSIRGLVTKLETAITNHKKAKDRLRSRLLYPSRLEVEMLKYVRQLLRDIDQEFDLLLKSDQQILKNYNLITSIKGVSRMVGGYLIVLTSNFKKIRSAKVAASYIGVCPFPNESGTIKKPQKVHYIGNHNLKRLLYISCISMLRYNDEFKNYYDRKKGEGKHHNVVMNSMINKLLRKIFAIVRDGYYDPTFIRKDPRFDNVKKVMR